MGTKLVGTRWIAVGLLLIGVVLVAAPAEARHSDDRAIRAAASVGCGYLARGPALEMGLTCAAASGPYGLVTGPACFAVAYYSVKTSCTEAGMAVYRGFRS